MARRGLPMAQGGGQDLPARERSPRRKPPDTAHERKDLPPRENTPLGESLPTRRTSERVCPAQEHAPRRRPPDTARRRKDLPRVRTLPTAKASRHGTRAKGFAPAQERSPRRRLPDTAQRRKDLPRAETLPTAKASRHGAKAKGFAPRGSPSPHMPTNGGPPSVDGQPEKHPFGGVAPTACGRCRVHSPKKIRLLHETQLFYGESHVGSRQIFPSFPSVGRCAARERNPVPPVAPHRGSEPRGLRRTGEMVRRFDAMCPRGSEWLPRGGELLPRGGQCGPSFRCFGERFHRRRCANPDACGGRRCSRGHDDLGQRAFRYFRPGIRHPLCDNEKTCGGRRCSRGQDDLGQRAFHYFRPTFRNRRRSGEKTFGGDGCPLGRAAGGGGGGGCGAALGRRPHGALHAVARPASADGARAREAAHVLRQRTRRRLPNGGAAPARTPRRSGAFRPLPDRPPRHGETTRRDGERPRPCRRGPRAAHDTGRPRFRRKTRCGRRIGTSHRRTHTLFICYDGGDRRIGGFA